MFFPILISKNFFEINIKNYLIFFLLNLLILEFIFLIFKKIYSQNPIFSQKENSSYYYDAHHIYLMFLNLMRILQITSQQNIFYKMKTLFPKLKTNNLGFLNGKNGNRDIQKTKKNVYTIGCLGNSTTLNI